MWDKAGVAAVFCAAAIGADSVAADSPLPAQPIEIVLAEPTTRYAHAVLGDAIEWGAVEGHKPDGSIAFRVTLPEELVFEDIEIRRISSYGFVIVESHRDLGARLAVYRNRTTDLSSIDIVRIAATPFIGRRYRWLAPAAIADFDGDGIDDVAYVETPHLRGILKIVTLRGDDQLVPIATPQGGFSNHRIGQDFITSDVRNCDGVVELLTPNLDWSRLMAVRLVNGELVGRPLEEEPSREGIASAKACSG